MQEIYNSLKKRTLVNNPEHQTGITTWFLLDKVRGQKTLPTFYQGTNQGIIANIQFLLQGTEHASLLESSPLLIKLNPMKLSETTHSTIQQERSGIFIQSHHDNILPHLQYLFTMHSERQGKVYTRYYDPICWTALTLSLANQQDKLWGNIEKVYTLSPADQHKQPNYLLWNKPEDIRYTPQQTPIILPSDFDEINKDLHLLYALQQDIYQINANITDSQLSRVLINLKILNNKGIERIDYLQRLVKPCIEHTDFAIKPQVQTILNQDVLAFNKVIALEQLVLV